MTERLSLSCASVSTPKRQTRSAASAHVPEIAANVAQTSIARLIWNSPLWHFSTYQFRRKMSVSGPKAVKFRPTREPFRPEINMAFATTDDGIRLYFEETG